MACAALLFDDHCALLTQQTQQTQWTQPIQQRCRQNIVGSPRPYQRVLRSHAGGTLRPRRWLRDVAPAGGLVHQRTMPVRQAVTRPSLYLHAHMVEVRKSALIRGFLQSNLDRHGKCTVRVWLLR